LTVAGQASASAENARVGLRLNGKGSEPWDFGGEVHVQLELVTDQPFLGMRLAAGNRPDIELPQRPGLNIQLKNMNGSAQFNSHHGGQVVGQFKRLVIPNWGQNSPSPSPSPKAQGSQSEFDPRSVPSLEMEVASLTYGGIDFGRVELRAQRAPNGLQNIVASIRAPRFSASFTEGQWLNGTDRKISTTASVKVSSDDTGRVLQQFGIFEGLKGGVLLAEFQAKWPGAPWQFSANQSSGNGEFTLEGGELLSIDSGFIKLMDVLTLKSLKFYEKGSKLNKTQGKISIKDGNLKLERAELDLASTNIRFRGDVDLVREQIATDVAMEVKISSAVALGAVGVMAGPAAALLGYLVSDNIKLPGVDLLNKLTAFSYRLEGPWAAPKVSEFKPKPFGL
jgi:uncharacterized protein YhdP